MRAFAITVVESRQKWYVHNRLRVKGRAAKASVPFREKETVMTEKRQGSLLRLGLAAALALGLLPATALAEPASTHIETPPQSFSRTGA